MEITQPHAKILMASCSVEPGGFVETFHRWIQEQDADGLLIDAADYAHVHHGPGVVLVAHDCMYSVDRADGRQGLAYRRRRGDPEPAFDGLSRAACAALRACTRLEQELADAIRFELGSIVVGCDDRLRAPNTPRAFEALEPALIELAAQLYPDGDRSIDQVGEPRAPFRAEISGQGAASLSELLSRLQTSP